MSNERRLTSLFKMFVQRTCIGLIKTEPKLLKEWLYFSTLISQQIIDYMRLQKYVESLNVPQSPKLDTSKLISVDEQFLPDYDGFLRKKLQIVEKFRQNQQSPTSYLNKTFGGERSHLDTLSIGPSQTYNRKGSDVASRGPPSQRGFAKRLTSLHEQFAQNDRRLSAQSSQLQKLADWPQEPDII